MKTDYLLGVILLFIFNICFVSFLLYYSLKSYTNNIILLIIGFIIAVLLFRISLEALF